MSDNSRDAAPKSPVEAVVETFVYAPIGLFFEGASLLPQLVEKGRNQVTMARMVGKFALEQATGEATKAAGKLQDQAAGVLDFIGGTVTPLPEPAPPASPPKPAAAARAGRPAPRRSPGAAKAAARKVAGVGAAPVASSAPTDLAIPDYDGLSASHVVNRLAGLTATELEAVRSYEAAHRGRKTILSKVAQLQSA